MLCISIIIPFLNEISVLPSCVKNIFSINQFIKDSKDTIDLEWIFVDGGSDDGSRIFLNKMGFDVVHADQGRAAQMNAGADGASGEWLVFLHADTRLPLSYFTRFLCMTKTDEWGFSHVSLLAKKKIFRLIEKSITFRSVLFKFVTGDQTIFIRRNLYNAGFRFPDVSLMEDVALSKRLYKVSRPKILHDPVQTSARKWQTGGILNTIIKMWMIQIFYRLGVNTERLRDWYCGDTQKNTGKKIAKNSNRNKKPKWPSDVKESGVEESSVEESSVEENGVILAQFAKAPVNNTVKTRLAPVLDAQQRTLLHCVLVEETLVQSTIALSAWSQSGLVLRDPDTNPPNVHGLCFHHLWVTAEHAFFDEMKHKYTTSLRAQKGRDLGERLAYAAKTSLLIAKHVMLIGSDCVELNQKVYQNVLNALAKNDAVVVPAFDGGFVLLALSRWHDALFSDIQWGEASVGKQLLENMQRLGWRVGVLNALNDIDRPEDLSSLPESIRARIT